MEQTTNYGLSQWAQTDRIQMEDFNSDNAKIDAALKASADAVASHTAAIAKLGNCAVYYETYKGNGELSMTRTFPGKPMLIAIGSSGGYQITACRGMNAATPHHSNGMVSATLTWGNNSITWSADSVSTAMNSGTSTYGLVALLDMSA